jgi:hypothetical protein
MRILLYGMQSSGASLITTFIGQLPRSVAVVDLWNSELMPPLQDLDADHVIGKAVVTTRYTFEEHARSFRPDRTLLVLRDPAQNYVSLSRKAYGAENGTVAQKLARLEEAFRQRDRFDAVMIYEDFVLRPDAAVAALRALDIPVTMEYLSFSRDPAEMRDFACSASPWCAENYLKKWEFGNVHPGAPTAALLHKHVPIAVTREVQRLCPSLHAFYRAYYAERNMTRFGRFRAGLVSDLLPRQWRRLSRRLQKLGSRGAAAAR